ncbi:hypothetical protein KFE25_003907 [Diacronema lutheri]|uniref:Fungal lipase-type domain-containing protein n=1 Tax=Diacronema lutheri TaxID=2081491 RepID=A0A8J5XFI4_DIALT|nr:hypothetical protein KFE25_003907 [Diacronema lutheri]
MVELKFEAPRRAGRARALASVGAGCVTLALIALLAQPPPGRLGLHEQTAGVKKRTPSTDQGEMDWCVAKAKKGACGSSTVARWCAQVCQANDMDGDCLQSILDIKCARLLPDSAARLADGKWGCYQGLFKHEVAACVDDSGGPVDCYEADSAATWVDADAQLRALIADNGCDSSEPSTWLPSHPHNTTGCTDMLPWASSTGRRGSGPAHECLDYARNGWCTLNTVVDRAKGGRLNNWPEEHCCACGGGNTVSPDVPEAEACAESQMAVHLSLAAYYNGTDLIQKLPEHFELIAEYHTRASADAFIGVGGGSCWAAFRGSEQDADWITDAVSALGTACAAANGQSIGECGLGFYVSHQSLRAAGLIDRLAALSREGRCPNGIRLTGHSLGAGLASIAAADLFTVGEDTNRTREIRLGQELTPHSLRVYTFGEPRSLRWYAADWFNSNVAKVRWLNWGDPIPASPPSSWGFKHWGQAREIRSDFFRKHSYKPVVQDHGASGLYLQNHAMEPYITRLAATCNP